MNRFELKQIIRDVIEEMTVIKIDKIDDCPGIIIKALDNDLYDSEAAINYWSQIHQTVLKHRHNIDGMQRDFIKFDEESIRSFMKNVIVTKQI